MNNPFESTNKEGQNPTFDFENFASPQQTELGQAPIGSVFRRSKTWSKLGEQHTLAKMPDGKIYQAIISGNRITVQTAGEILIKAEKKIDVIGRLSGID